MKLRVIQICFWVTFLFLSCKKEKDVPAPPAQNPPVKVITNANLHWNINYVSGTANTVVATLPLPPNPHCVDSINMVFVLSTINGAQPIGNNYTPDNFYYKIQNNSVIIYRENVKLVGDFPVALMFVTGARIEFH